MVLLCYAGDWISGCNLWWDNRRREMVTQNLSVGIKVDFILKK